MIIEEEYHYLIGLLSIYFKCIIYLWKKVTGDFFFFLITVSNLDVHIQVETGLGSY